MAVPGQVVGTVRAECLAGGPNAFCSHGDRARFPRQARAYWCLPPRARSRFLHLLTAARMPHSWGTRLLVLGGDLTKV